MHIRKRNIWKILLINLAFYNGAMVVIWTIQTAFGYTPHYWLSFCITNSIAVLIWLFRILDLG